MLKTEDLTGRRRNTERRFAESWYNTKGGDIWGSDKRTEKEMHIDIFWQYDGDKRPISFEVRGIKESRDGEAPPEYTEEWIEFTDAAGKSGWINGQADFIVFESLDDWIIISRKRLKECIQAKIMNTDVTDDRSTWYRYYQRKGGKGKSVKVPTHFIRKNADRILIKAEFLEPYLKID